MTKQKIKIALLGLGGVGGYYGGLLARKYEKDENVEIYFIARGTHLEKIKKKGIRIISDGDDFFAQPTLATDNPEEIGPVDYLILANKSYDLFNSVESIKPCIGENTVILPLLNGGDITEQIRDIIPETTIWSGCSYIVSRRLEPGVIRSVGDFSRLVFGYDGGINERTKELEKLMRQAGIDVKLVESIRDSIWQKFYFISVSASLTSYYDVSFNQLAEKPDRIETTLQMSCEFLRVAKAEGIDVSRNNKNQVVKRIGELPKDTTTSMHSDFQNGNPTEVETLTGTIVRLAEKHGIDVPYYKKVYNDLINR